MRRLAMDGNEDLRTDPLVHLLQFVAARMAGNMHQRIAVGDDLDALLDQAVLDVDDRLLVAGNGARGKDHRVAGGERDMAHLVAGKLGKGGARLALAAGQDDHDLVARDIAEFVFGDERA